VILEGIDDELQPREVIELERAQPLGARRLAIFSLEADDRQGLAERARELIALASETQDAPIRTPGATLVGSVQAGRSRQLGMAVIAGTFPSLRRGLDHAVQTLAESRDLESAAMCDVDVQVIPPREPLGTPPRVASSIRGWATCSRHGPRAVGSLAGGLPRTGCTAGIDARPVLARCVVESALPTVFDDHRGPILGQVAVGSLATDILALLGVAPSAAIGYSMGNPRRSSLCMPGSTAMRWHATLSVHLSLRPS